MAQRDPTLPVWERRAVVAPDDLDLRPRALVPGSPEGRLGRQCRRQPLLAALRHGETFEGRSLALGQPPWDEAGTGQDPSSFLHGNADDLSVPQDELLGRPHGGDVVDRPRAGHGEPNVLEARDHPAFRDALDPGQDPPVLEARVERPVRGVGGVERSEQADPPDGLREGGDPSDGHRPQPDRLERALDRRG